MRLGDIFGMNGVDRECAFRQRSGLVEHDCVDLRKSLHIVGALYEYAVTRSSADAAEERQRNGNDQCARARDNEEGKRALDPSAPETPCAVSAHEHGDKRRYNREHNGSDNDAGSIPAREAGDEVLGSRLFLRGVFNELENLRDRALLKAALSPDMDNAGKIYRSARHSVADRLVCGQALACQGGGIDRSRAVNYLAVKRNLFAGLDNYRLAELNFLGRHGLLFSVAHDYGIVGADIHKRGY